MSLRFIRKDLIGGLLLVYMKSWLLYWCNFLEDMKCTLSSVLLWCLLRVCQALLLMSFTGMSSSVVDVFYGYVKLCCWCLLWVCQALLLMSFTGMSSTVVDVFYGYVKHCCWCLLRVCQALLLMSFTGMSSSVVVSKTWKLFTFVDLMFCGYGFVWMSVKLCCCKQKTWKLFTFVDLMFCGYGIEWMSVCPTHDVCACIIVVILLPCVPVL